MKWHDEIAKIARELYEKSGRVEGRELDNWLEAERIVMAQYKEHEKPETETASVEGKVKKAPKKVSQKSMTKPKEKREKRRML
ncbi:MAG: DUF2934 domain-containing protein [Nitrospirae bacterium]|jgi:hypothetical protein|nr:DUF2934 domain-containing protein [Nitrospirota bacterium]